MVESPQKIVERVQTIEMQKSAPNVLFCSLYAVAIAQANSFLVPISSID